MPTGIKMFNDLDPEIQALVYRIMAEEDRQIHEILEDLVIQCQETGHPGYGEPLEECDHPDCVSRFIHQD